MAGDLAGVLALATAAAAKTAASAGERTKGAILGGRPGLRLGVAPLAPALAADLGVAADFLGAPKS